LSYRQLEEFMQERDVWVDRSSINRWMLKYSPRIEVTVHHRKRPVWISSRMDETHIRDCSVLHSDGHAARKSVGPRRDIHSRDGHAWACGPSMPTDTLHS